MFDDFIQVHIRFWEKVIPNETCVLQFEQFNFAYKWKFN